MAKGSVIAADGAHDVAPIHRGGMADKLPAVFDRSNHFLVGEGMVIAAARERFAEFADILAPTADHTIIRMRREEGDLLFETVRPTDVVGIHARDQRRACFVEHLVEAGDESAIFPDDRTDTGIACGMFADDRGRGVLRSVIDDQELEIRKALREHAGDGFVEIALAVVDAHGNADRRCRHDPQIPILCCGPRHAVLGFGLSLTW